MAFSFYDLTGDTLFVPKGKKKEDEYQYITDNWMASLPQLEPEPAGPSPIYASESPLPWQEISAAEDPYAGLFSDAPIFSPAGATWLPEPDVSGMSIDDIVGPGGPVYEMGPTPQRWTEEGLVPEVGDTRDPNRPWWKKATELPGNVWDTLNAWDEANAEANRRRGSQGFFESLTQAGPSNFRTLTGMESEDVPGGRVGQAIAEELFNPINYAGLGVSTPAGLGSKATKLANIAGPILGPENAPLKRAGFEVGTGIGARLAGEEAATRLPEDIPLVPEWADPYARGGLVIGVGGLGGIGTLTGLSSAGKILRGLDTGARGLDARINEPAGFEASGRTAAAMTAEEPPHTVFHGTNGPLEGEPRPGMKVTPSEEDAMAYAKATTGLQGGEATVHAFDVTNPSALSPMAPEEGLAAARGGMVVNDPSGIRLRTLEEKAASNAITPIEAHEADVLRTRNTIAQTPDADPIELARANADVAEAQVNSILAEAAGGGAQPPRTPRVSQAMEPEPEGPQPGGLGLLKNEGTTGRAPLGRTGPQGSVSDMEALLARQADEEKVANFHASASPEQVAAMDAVRPILAASEEARLSKGDMSAARADQASRYNEASAAAKAAGASPMEADAAGRAAMAGQLVPQTTPADLPLQQQIAIGDRIDEAWEAGVVNDFERVEAFSGWRKILTGSRTIEPKEAESLRRVFGEVFVDRVLPDQPKVGTGFEATGTALPGFEDVGGRTTQGTGAHLRFQPPIEGSVVNPEGVRPEVSAQSTPVDLIEQRDAALARFKEADELANTAERQALGVSRSEYEASLRVNETPSVTLSPEEAAARRMPWEQRLAAAEDQGAATEAARLRAQADTELARYNDLAAQFEPEGVGDIPTSGPKMRPRVNEPEQTDLEFYRDIEWDNVKKTAEKNWGIRIVNTAGHITVEALLGGRTLAASADFSYALRQGSPFAFAHPKEWWEGMKKSIDAWHTERGALEAQAYLDSRPNAKIRKDANLVQTDIRSGAGAEEGFRAPWAESLNLRNLPKVGRKIEAGLKQASVTLPGGKKVSLADIPNPGDIVSASARAYATMLNWVRAQTFDHVWDNLPTEHQTAANAKSLAGLLNAFSGQGTLPKFLTFDHSRILNIIFFAPRYMVSRPEMIGRAAWTIATNKSPQMKWEATKLLLGYAAGGAALMSFGAILNWASRGKIGWEADIDPYSGSFGNWKIGPATFDPWAGNAQIVKAVIQMATGKRRNSNTGELYDVHWGDPLARFFRGKLAPGPSQLWDQVDGRDFNGERVSRNPLKAIAAMNTPISGKEMTDAYMAWGLKGALLAMPGLSGLGVNVKGRNDYNIQLEEEYKNWNPKEEGFDYEKPDKPTGDLLFELEFREAHPDVKPEVRGERGEKLNALRNEYKDRQTANIDDFRSGKISVGEWTDWRSTLSYARQEEVDQVVGDFTGQNPKPGTPDYWVKTYGETFVRHPSGRPDRDATRANQDKWLKENGGDALVYVNRVFATNKAPEDKAYIEAMQVLSGKGYFDRSKMPHYNGLSEGADEVELEKLEQWVKDKRGAEPGFSEVDWEKSAIYLLEEKGVDFDTITDVLKVHRAKNAYSSISARRNPKNSDLRYIQEDYLSFKEDHPRELAWLDDRNSYEQILEIYGGSWPE